MRTRIGFCASSGYGNAVNDFARQVQQLAKSMGGQDKLADALEVSQGTVSRWINGTAPKNALLVERIAKMARAVSPNIESADNARAVMLPVVFPSESVLRRMFDGLLLSADTLDRSELAQRLAERLPIALARAIDAPPVPVRDQAPGVSDQDHPTHRPPHRPL